MMSGRTTDSNPPARSAAATRSARSSVPSGKHPTSSRPGTLLLAWITTPGSRWLVGIITTMPSTCRRVRCRVSSLATPFCPLTSVTSGEVCSATSRITAAVWWLFTVTTTAVSGSTSRSASDAAARSGTTSSPCGVTSRRPLRADRVEVRATGDGLHVDTGEVEPGREHAADRAGAVHDDSHGRHSRNE